MRSLQTALIVAITTVTVAVADQQPPVAPRDPRSEQPDRPVGTATLTGTVLVAGTGQPARNARVNVSSAELRGGRTAVTDARGRFTFSSLPAGRYSLSASKTGHVNTSYGQKRPGAGNPGTPIQLTEGQRFEATLQLPRGGVITGTILDEHGDAVPGTQVRVLRYVLQNGVRTLVQSGGGSTDDRGIYRIYGLQPAEYLVVAMPRGPGQQMPPIEQMRAEMQALRERAIAIAQQDAELARQLRDRAANLQPQVEAMGEEPATGYAPVYYPGTTLPTSAAALTVGVGEERGGADFQLQLVPIARVEGIVTGPADAPTRNVQVTLVPIGYNVPGVGTQSARVDQDGKLAIANVARGQYRLVARTGGGPPARLAAEMAARGMPPGRGQGPFGRGGPGALNAPRLWAMSDIAVDGRNVQNVVLTLQTGMTVSGRVVFQGTTRQPPADLTQLRISLVPAATGDVSREVASAAAGRTEAEGRFTIEGVAPGMYRLTAANAGTGWTMESSTIGGQDSLDFPVEVKPGQNVSGAIVTMTDRQSELTGLVTDSRGQPATDFTVVVFADDQRFWTPPSRRIQSTRPATDGRFTFRNLPPGDYRLATAVDPEPGAWYDPAFLQQLETSSVRVSIAEGEKKVQDVRVSGVQ